MERTNEELIKIIDTKQYEEAHPKPSILIEHQKNNPDSFYVQFIGCGGVGKSTLINGLLNEVGFAETGITETTKETGFYKVTNKVVHKTNRYNDVFLVDQPGIGGFKIKEDGYLKKYGPGHFSYTFILCADRFQELDLNLLQHLIFNNRPVAVVRTRCDEAVRNIRRDSRKMVSLI